MNIYLKWILIVGLNSVLGFVLGARWEQNWFPIGMILGVMSWLFAYIYFDKYLISIGRIQESKRLAVCASLRIPLQLTLLPEMYAGRAAIITVDFTGLDSFNSSFVEAYFLTVFTGLYLSFICALIYFLLYAMTEIGKIKKTNAQ